jgi:ABC-type Na+ efflux pump permease subunit
MLSRWLGPLLSLEMLRLGRRGQTFIVRVFVAFLVLGALAVYTAGTFSNLNNLQVLHYEAVSLRVIDETDKSTDAATIMGRLIPRLAREFSEWAMFGIVTLILFIVPLGVASSIAEERDRKTIEFLLTTDLTSREIIFGKLGIRVWHCFYILLVIIPVLSIMQVWGGVEIPFVIAACFIGMLGVIATTAFCIWASLHGTSFMRSLLWCFLPILGFYLLTVSWYYREPAFLYADPQISQIMVYVSLINPLIILRVVQARPDLLTQYRFEFWQGIYPAFTLLFTLFFYWRSCHGLRELAFKVRQRKLRRGGLIAMPASVKTGNAKPGSVATRHWADPPAIGDDEDGLYWKEKYFTSFGWNWLKKISFIPSWVWVLGIVTLSMLTLAVMSSDLSFASQIPKLSAGLTKNIGLLAMLIIVSVVGMTACSSVARERQKETLVDLIMTPVDRKEILTAKWWGAMYQGRAMTNGFASLMAIGVFCQGLSYLALPMLLLLGWAWRSIAVSYGLYLSVRCKSVQRASFLWASGLCCWLVLPSVFSIYLYAIFIGYNSPYMDGRAYYPDLLEANLATFPWVQWLHYVILPHVIDSFAPLNNWFKLVFVTDDGWGTGGNYGLRPIRNSLPVIAALAGVMLQFLWVRILWRMTCRHFESEIIK